MAYWIDESNQARGTSNQMSYYCDTTADVQDLPTSTTPGVQQGEDTISCRPCGKGSFCLCIGTSSGYILNSNDQWVAV